MKSKTIEEMIGLCFGDDGNLYQGNSKATYAHTGRVIMQGPIGRFWRKADGAESVTCEACGSDLGVDKPDVEVELINGEWVDKETTDERH